MKLTKGVSIGVLWALFLFSAGFSAEMVPNSEGKDFVKPGESQIIKNDSGDVVINEILYRREMAGSPEFVELYNRSLEPVDLSNWQLVTGSGEADLPESIVLQGNEYVVFTDHEEFAMSSESIYYLPQFPGLTDNGSLVAVYEKEGGLADSLQYSSEWDVIGRGVSLERKDPEALSVDPANWGASVSESGSTPGLQNSRYRVDLLPPNIEFATLKAEKIEVYFDEFIQFQDLQSSKSRQSQSDFRTQFSVNGVLLSVVEFDRNRANRMILDARQLDSGRELMLRAEDLADHKGNVTTVEQVIAQPLERGDVVVNEVMYHPLQGDDEFSEQSEYLEIYNRQPYAVSLSGVYLHDEPDEEGEVREMIPVDAERKWIPAQGYALFYPENDAITLSESRTGEFFGFGQEVDSYGLRVERTTLGLVLSGRPVYLADSTGAWMDRIHYSPGWHNPNLLSTRGVSLERIDPAGESDEPENWSSSSTAAGGTPMAENSIFRTGEMQVAQSVIELLPNPFSPDEDNLEISYSFDDPDYLLKIHVYDRYGRRIRKLTDNYPAGLNGSIAWDGRKDDGSRNRVGIYIIYVEAFNASTGDRKQFKETAVLARRF